MELIDVVNENDEVIGVKDKDLVHRDGNWHRASRMWVLNSKDDVLIHQRAESKKILPAFWDTTIGGHVLSGENYEEAAKRELKEEIGIENVKLFEIRKLRHVPNKLCPFEKLIVKIFLVKYDGNIEDLDFDKNEISKAKFIKLSELEKISKNNKEKKKFVYLDDLEILKSFVKKLSPVLYIESSKSDLLQRSNNQ